MTDTQATEQNIVIVRRGGGDDDETPHGGVWKIAYADFMTAMMAFFLVMWLINATNETTRTGVANYFNPIKMAEGTRLPKKGMVDPAKAEPGGSDATGEEKPGPTPDPADEDSSTGTSEAAPPRETATWNSGAAVFRDPYAVLAQIGAQAGTSPGDGPAGSRGAGAPAQSSDRVGAASRAGDQTQRDAPDPGLPAGGPGAATPASARPDAWPTGPVGPTPAGETARPDARQTAAPAPTPLTGPTVAERDARIAGALAALARAQRADDARAGADGNGGRGPGRRTTGDPADAEQQAMQILRRLTEDGAAHPMPHVTVTSGDDGMLISLSDQVDFGMFAIGSAEPLPETVAVMARIAEVLNGLPGKVIIRGYTDARPFRAGRYDNWLLSAARAHMAFGMLVQGGLDKARVMRIEAHADRELKVPDDPLAAENRRIEILVRGVPS